MATQLLGIEAKRGRIAGQRRIRCVADPPLQRCFRSGNLHRKLIATVCEFCGFLLRHNDVGRHATAPDQLRLHRVCEQLILPIEIVEQRCTAFEIKTFEPSECSVTPDREHADATLDLRFCHRGGGNVGCGVTLAAIRHVLHHANLAHRHEITREAPLLLAGDGEVLDAERQFGVR